MTYRERDGVYPRTFTARIGGMLGSSFEVNLIKPNILRYVAYAGSQCNVDEEIPVTHTMWNEVMRRLFDANVFNWKDEYINPFVHDGTRWNVEIEFDDLSVKTMGLNDYPEDKEFLVFLDTMSWLVGGKEFR